MAERVLLFDGKDVEAARGSRLRSESVIAISESAALALSQAGIAASPAIDALGDDPELPWRCRHDSQNWVHTKFH